MMRREMCLKMVSVALCSWLFGAGCATTPEGAGEAAREVSASLSLPVPEQAMDRDYLGLPEGSMTFGFGDIEAELVIVDLFDMYCHSCQTAAKYVHEMYEEVQARGLSGKVKFVGLGVGNTEYEAATFRRKFELPFPVFADRKGEMANCLGGLKIPALVGVRKREGIMEIIHRSTGVPRAAEQILDHILEDAATMAPVDPVDRLHAGVGSCEEGQPQCLQESQVAGDGKGSGTPTVR